MILAISRKSACGATVTKSYTVPDRTHLSHLCPGSVANPHHSILQRSNVQEQQQDVQQSPAELHVQLQEKPMRALHEKHTALKQILPSYRSS